MGQIDEWMWLQLTLLVQRISVAGSPLGEVEGGYVVDDVTGCTLGFGCGYVGSIGVLVCVANSARNRIRELIPSGLHTLGRKSALVIYKSFNFV